MGEGEEDRGKSSELLELFGEPRRCRKFHEAAANSATTYLCTVAWRPDKFLSRTNFWRLFCQSVDSVRADDTRQVKLGISLFLSSTRNIVVGPAASHQLPASRGEAIQFRRFR